MPKLKQQPINKVLANVAEAVKKCRYDKRLTQSTLAEMAGVSVPLLYSLETGQCENISLDKLIKVANAVGFNIVSVNLIPNQS